MKAPRRKKRTGLTLVEIMVAILITVVAVIGAMGFRYYCALDARKADIQITACRIGSMLLEGWKGAGAVDDYDPVADFDSSLDISTSAGGHAIPGGFTVLERYRVGTNNINFYVVMSYKAETPTVPKVLSASVGWRVDRKNSPASASDPSVTLTNYAE